MIIITKYTTNMIFVLLIHSRYGFLAMICGWCDFHRTDYIGTSIYLKVKKIMMPWRLSILWSQRYEFNIYIDQFMGILEI